MFDKKEIEVLLPPEVAYDEFARYRALLDAVGAQPGEADFVHLRKRSIDARGRQPLVRLRADVWFQPPPTDIFGPWFTYPDVSQARRSVLIVGAGPAGLFAALRAIELGIKPIVLERGKDVRTRRRDLAALNKDHVVNPDSNYCFGEGGAGTYSDGKLYTRATKRGDVGRILKLLVQHGATPDILVDAHPHIGTNKLPQVVAALRDSVIRAGGEVRFETRVEDLILEKNHLRGVVTATGEAVEADAVILATGHSARDIYELLHRRGVRIEAKPFALGVRVEHPQALIDQAQYRRAGPRAAAGGFVLASAPNPVARTAAGRFLVLHVSGGLYCARGHCSWRGGRERHVAEPPRLALRQFGHRGGGGAGRNGPEATRRTGRFALAAGN